MKGTGAASVIISLVAVLLVGGCSRQSEEAGPAQEESIARACEPLARATARQTVRPEGEFSTARIAYATQVRSIDAENFNLVAVEFAVDGSPHETGLWAIGVGAEKGVGYALNDVAHRASSWPTSSSDPSHARLFTARSVYDAERCL